MTNTKRQKLVEHLKLSYLVLEKEQLAEILATMTINLHEKENRNERNKKQNNHPIDTEV